MTFTIWLLIVLVAIIGVLLIRKYSSLEFVAHARLLFKAWSVWLASAGSALGAWVQSFPDSAMNAWSMLPQDVKSFLPPSSLGFLASFMVAMAVISQFVRQRKLVEQKQQLEQRP